MLTPSFLDRQYDALYAPLLGSGAQCRPSVLPSLLVNGLNGPALEASGLSVWVLPMNTVLRASAQKPLITEDLLKSPLVTKLIPPFWTSLTTLLTTNGGINFVTSGDF